jgi:hypothetical protein
LQISIFGQFSIGISISGIGYHPRGNAQNASFYKWKIDRIGKFTGFANVSLLASYRFNDYFGVKIMQSIIFHDCAGKFAGLTHLGINLYDDILHWKNPKSEFSMSFGPLWYYRKDWTKEKRYQNNPQFITLSKNKRWEHKFVWHGGLIQYDYFLDNNTSLTTTLFPGYPYLYTFGVGGAYHFR